MTNTEHEVLAFIKENEVKMIKLTFCDLFGVQKQISIMPDELSSAFVHGVSFDAYAIRGFCDVSKSDLLLYPDPVTLSVLPWRPGPGRIASFYCDIRKPDHTALEQDSRNILKQVIKRCEDMGYVCKLGAECEFYLFKLDENGEPTQDTIDYGGYLDIPPLDKAEDIRREICLCLEELGLKPEASHHEQGPGQNEIDFQYSDALSSADNLMTFKSVVKAIAARNGFFASFMPKPLPGHSGSGLHINLSLSKNGFNIFKNREGEHCDVAESFIAGILERAPEITLFLNTIANSYERLGQFEAPRYVSWSHQNRSQLVRIPAAIGERVRMELRSPDPAVNPYLAFALIIGAGIDGIERKLPLPEAVDANLYRADESITRQLVALPTDLDQAILLAENSAFVKGVIGQDVLSKYIGFKKEEARLYRSAIDKAAFCREQYFQYI